MRMLLFGNRKRKEIIDQNGVKESRIQFHDKWQFEVVNEFYPFYDTRGNNLIQEFYFFIPSSLQINDQTYSKTQYYIDQTNLVRLKTPRFTFAELNNPDNPETPLSRIRALAQQSNNQEELKKELKIFGSVFEIALSTWINSAIANPDAEKIAEGYQELEKVIAQYRLLAKQAGDLQVHYDYIDEYISLRFNSLFVELIKKVRQQNMTQTDQLLSEAIIKEKKYRERFNQKMNSDTENEFPLFRQGLLNKYVADPFLLWTSRASVDQRFRYIISGIPAAIAMLFFLILYVWQGNVFVFNSQPFILFTVLIYVMKDRLKEELRFFSYRQAAKWFSDYSTDIREKENSQVIGKLKEYVSFINETNVPAEILEIRNRQFDKVLEEIRRPEKILYYKKSLRIDKTELQQFYGFITFFRFDIHNLIAKTEDPYQSFETLDEKGNLIQTQLPRVYHLNIVVKTQQNLLEDLAKIEVTKLRIILNKAGILRIEEL